MPDPYLATWISHSSLSDYLACPRAYFLKNVYKDPQTRHKLQIVSPALSLGSAVHEVLEDLSQKNTQERFKESLLIPYEKVWQKYQGLAGGFISETLEKEVFQRGREMLLRVQEKPGPLKNLAVKIKGDLPNFFLSEEDNLILCGKIDWLEYLPKEQAVRIIDFKTSKSQERESSLQLPIYALLVHHCQQYQVAGAAYWYLGLPQGIVEKILPSLDSAREKVLTLGKKVALARKLKTFKCPHGGCLHCEPYEKILRGEAQKVGTDSKMRRDNYFLSLNKKQDEELEEIL